MNDYQKKISDAIAHAKKGRTFIFRPRCPGKPMKEIDIQELINVNYRILTLLGIATSMIMDYKNLEAYHDNSEKCDWFVTAIQAIVYENKPLPQMP
jgi:hypothetical protein